MNIIYNNNITLYDGILNYSDFQHPIIMYTRTYNYILIFDTI